MQAAPVTNQPTPQPTLLQKTLSSKWLSVAFSVSATILLVIGTLAYLNAFNSMIGATYGELVAWGSWGGAVFLLALDAIKRAAAQDCAPKEVKEQAGEKIDPSNLKVLKEKVEEMREEVRLMKASVDGALQSIKEFREIRKGNSA